MAAKAANRSTAGLESASTVQSVTYNLAHAQKQTGIRANTSVYTSFEGVSASKTTIASSFFFFECVHA